MANELHFPNTKFVPCSGGCGWDVPLPEDDPRTEVLCHECNPETRGKPLKKCDCDGCTHGETHTGVWTLH